MAIYTITLHVVGQVYVDLYLKAQVDNDHDNRDHDNQLYSVYAINSGPSSFYTVAKVRFYY